MSSDRDDRSAPPKLGFACTWDPEPQGTWSGTPWRLRAALMDRTEVTDLDTAPGRASRFALRAAAARRHDGRWISPWRYTSLGMRVVRHNLRREVRRQPCDAVIEIGDLGQVDRPYFLVQDLTTQSVLDHFEDGGAPHFPGLTRSALAARVAWQQEVYGRAAGILAMSAWMADSVIAQGVPREKVSVIHPAAIATIGAAPPRPRRRTSRRTRLLLIGRDLHTKGGDIVVAALEILRREVDPDVTLTVAGPAVWPFPGSPPKGVAFVGRVPAADVVRLYDTHDLFVMPSRLEGFGMVFAEALSRGLPCVGRDAFAMPELIQPGVNGGLIRSLDPVELAQVIADTLVDEDLYRQCWAQASAVAEHYTWDRMAAEVLDAVGARLGVDVDLPA
jgi:glycosyltransferase involved in cell wall biosynthesis